MSAEEAEDGAREGEDETATGSHGAGGEERKGLNAMQSFIAERELDEQRVVEAEAKVAELTRRMDEEERVTNARLAAVEVNREDVEVLKREFNLDDKAAERRIRECGGDALKAIHVLLEE